MSGHAQLTLDGREVAHPIREEPETRSYVVLVEKVPSSFDVVGVVTADRPSTARRRARDVFRLIPEASLVVVALRFWNDGT